MNVRPQKKHAAAASNETPGPVQAVLPNVRVIVTDTGTLDVTVDGAVFPPPPRGEWTRGSFTDLLDAVTKDRSVAVRIEVREVDGSVFTDLIHPRKRTRTPESVPPSEPAKPVWKLKGPVLVEVTADGFLPGEDVAVAIIVSHTDAAGGRACALLDLNQLPTPTSRAQDVLLFGRISGTVHIETLP
ncbi:hypothetical protein ACQ3I4_14695 [Zafaria sp. Z1313]|uniref:hypothetical protein n=1 Tax=Micrococcales TaxID=85006 RepID=UPI003B807AFC